MLVLFACGLLVSASLCLNINPLLNCLISNWSRRTESQATDVNPNRGMKKNQKALFYDLMSSFFCFFVDHFNLSYWPWQFFSSPHLNWNIYPVCPFPTLHSLRSWTTSSLNCDKPCGIYRPFAHFPWHYGCDTFTFSSSQIAFSPSSFSSVSSHRLPSANLSVSPTWRSAHLSFLPPSFISLAACPFSPLPSGLTTT